MRNKGMATAARVGVLQMAVLLALASTAHAQEQNTTTLDRLEVTGSRIRGAEMETRQPVITLTREAMQRQGFTSVADVLQNLTSAGSPAIARAQALSSGEEVGGYYVDIRNLGATRTLVLINGKRLGATTGGYQDLGQIPMAAIERIDILKDGASSIYGSDAIAGVVNVITRKQMDGLEVNADWGQNSRGDGKTQTFSMTQGIQGERGGALLSVEYYKQDPVSAADRWYSKYGNAGRDYPRAGWSPVSQNGSLCDPCVIPGLKEGDPGYVAPSAVRWWTLKEGGNPANRADYRLHTSADNANANEQMSLQTGLERRSVFASGYYDLNDQVTFNAEVLYNHRRTDQQIAGYPYQSAAFDTHLSPGSVFNPTPGQEVNFRRRLWEVPRTTRSELETFRFAGSLNGHFELRGRQWDWDVGGVWNRNDSTKTGHGDASLIATRQALGPSFINGNGIAQCGTAANPVPLTNCRPWNPLLPYGVEGQGSLANGDLQTFLFPYYTDTGLTRTTSYSANLSGSLFDLPAGEVGLAVGVEHRKEQGRFTPDAFSQSGQSTGLGGSTTEGSYSLDEVYLELNVPVLADVAGAKELSFNLASRYSDYSNFGDTTNSKFGFTWRPVDDLLVRGTFAEGFRAPSISNLYGGYSTSFEAYVDPCGTGATNSVNGNAACNGAGVPLGYVQLGQGLEACTTYPCQTPDQFLSLPNANLAPETSRSRTIGLVWSPQWVSGLDLSLDWYRYKLKNMIISDSVDRILRDCYILGNASRCGTVQRDPGDGHITGMSYGLINLGRMDTEGYDLGVKYRLPELSWGKITVDWQTSYTRRYDELGQNSDGVDIMMGRVGEPGIFRVRSNLGLDWEIGDFGISYTARYYSGMKESCVPNRPCTDPDRYANGEPDAIRRVGANTFHDIQGRVQLPWDATVSLGLNNMFNHQAALLFSNSEARHSSFPYYGGFDTGRYLYLKYQQRF